MPPRPILSGSVTVTAWVTWTPIFTTWMPAAQEWIGQLWVEDGNLSSPHVEIHFVQTDCPLGQPWLGQRPAHIRHPTTFLAKGKPEHKTGG